MKKAIGFLLLFTIFSFKPVEPSLKLALVKYNGGGDWYANPTALTNLANFCNQTLGTNFDPDYATVDVGSIDIYNFPFLHMTGHGNVVFSDSEAENLRNYLISGGFLHIDDNYGMDKFLRPSMKKVFPELEFVELPFSHEIYNQQYTFKSGPPKIHKHDDDPAQGFGLLWEGRVVCFYTFQSDIGDGWEDEEVHKDPVELRLKALQMGANIIQYAFSF
ncbi:DUF4159 domain-containing protein [Portibacter lacus]|uniref:DUF4159 domain-containing protein n=1 Tax=Portibacter lacus TaxID=1099794 RepID=A0AA37WDQ5_9BACT|nr:DUF4159 domain-containing protein [Portibacter lacus]GLR17233.1 hypothetical protein GCM10007940_18480 [Portibacter lacus]